MPGHVFVTRGDITKLRCNAWLLPTDAFANVTDAWKRAAQQAEVRLPALSQVPDGWREQRTRAMRIKNPWRKTLNGAPETVAILTNTGATSDEGLEWYVAGIEAFVAEAQSLAFSPTWRSRPLYAIPFVGSGAGGQGSKKGELARRVIEALHAIALAHEFDLALVLFSESAYAGVQTHRPADSWPEADLPLHLRTKADRLAELAVRGDLVFFFGAGVSYAAGLPLWKDLIEVLGRDAGLSSLEIEHLGRMSVLDGASILSIKATHGGKNFKKLVAAACDASAYSLSHTLLATIGCREAVTTNYDRLYEMAVIDTDQQLSVLPHAPNPESRRWLLKLHGSSEKAEDIVLTRQDYLRYEGTRSALQGIVQAMLITRHILFIGFSLNDDNFHVLIDAVRRAIGRDVAGNGVRPQPFGTALLQSAHPLLTTLWESDLDIITTLPRDGLGESELILESARQTEIFLDYLAYRSESAAKHLLNEDYSGGLDDTDRRVKDALLRLKAAVSGHVDRRAYDPIRKLLDEYGS